VFDPLEDPRNVSILEGLRLHRFVLLHSHTIFGYVIPGAVIDIEVAIGRSIVIDSVIGRDVWSGGVIELTPPITARLCIVIIRYESGVSTSGTGGGKPSHQDLPCQIYAAHAKPIKPVAAPLSASINDKIVAVIGVLGVGIKIPIVADPRVHHVELGSMCWIMLIGPGLANSGPRYLEDQIISTGPSISIDDFLDDGR